MSKSDCVCGTKQEVGSVYSCMLAFLWVRVNKKCTCESDVRARLTDFNTVFFFSRYTAHSETAHVMLTWCILITRWQECGCVLLSRDSTWQRELTVCKLLKTLQCSVLFTERALQPAGCRAAPDWLIRTANTTTSASADFSAQSALTSWLIWPNVGNESA